MVKSFLTTCASIGVLLLISAWVVAVDLSGLVDEVFNATSPLERFQPNYVFYVNGCKVLVFITDFDKKNSPLTAGDITDLHILSNKTSSPLNSTQAERLLDALLKRLGPPSKVTVAMAHRRVVVEDNSSISVTLEWRDLHIAASTARGLREEAERALGEEVLLGPKDVREAIRAGRQEVAYLTDVVWQNKDVRVVITLDLYHTSLDVATADLAKAVELLRDVREEVGPIYDSVRVTLKHGPYFLPRDETFRAALINATQTIEKELGTVREVRDVCGHLLGIEGTMHTFAPLATGPLYVVFPFPGGTAPDRATAERLVRRFVELSSFCESPLVVEFWPKTGIDFLVPECMPRTWLFAMVAAVGVAIAVAVGLLMLKRRLVS